VNGWVAGARQRAGRQPGVLVPGVRRPGRGDASTPRGLTCHGHWPRPDDVRRRWARSDPSPSRSLSWGDATRGRMWTARRSWRRFSRLVTDGDMSPFDHPLGDVRPWMSVDASATVSPWPAVPRSSWCAHPGSASCTGWAVRGPDRHIFFRCGKPKDLVDAPPGFFFGPVQAEGWMA
jgi:hypothetical protein